MTQYTYCNFATPAIFADLRRSLPATFSLLWGHADSVLSAFIRSALPSKVCGRQTHGVGSDASTVAKLPSEFPRSWRSIYINVMANAFRNTDSLELRDLDSSLNR